MNLPQSRSDRWVLVTGASSGIGEAFVRRYAREGWNVAMVARSRQKLEAIAQELGRTHQVRTLVIEADLSNHRAPREIFDTTARAGIEIEALVNNAGFGSPGKFWEAPLERYLAMIDVHVRSLLELTHLYMGGMINRRRGAIINVSSMASFQPLPYSSVYSATKAFVTALTEALWMESQGTGVRVINLCPGLTKTDFGLKAGHGDFHQLYYAETAEQVVETTFRALKGHWPTVISGWMNRVLYFMVRLTPHRILLVCLPWIQKIRKRS